MKNEFKKSTEAVVNIIDTLNEVDPKEKSAVFRAVAALLEGNDVSVPINNLGSTESVFNAKVEKWLSSNGLTSDDLQKVFDMAGGQVDLIVPEIPGSSKREKTINAYILEGLRRFVLSGDLSFDDKSARKLCEINGCYDQANHASYLKSGGNKFIGSKNLGWKLTTPGLMEAARVVRSVKN